MKQRIRVIGIVKSGEKFLLLKRTIGRSEEQPTWELPTGKIRFGEQPEEALARAFYEYLGIEVSKIKLLDVITFINISDSSQLANLYIIYEVAIPETRIVPEDRYVAYKYLKIEEMSALKLDEATISVLAVLDDRKKDSAVEDTRKSEKEETSIDEHDLSSVLSRYNNAKSALNGATVYVDGGSKGNPGPSAIGYYIIGDDGKELKRGGEFIGFATSRVAEYYAMREGIEQAVELGLRKARFVGDNLMMINQLRGIYQVKNQDIMPIYNDIRELLRQFDSYVFVHVKRAQNVEADREANKALEGHFTRKGNRGF